MRSLRPRERVWGGAGLVLAVLIFGCARRSSFGDADRLLAEARYEEALVAYRTLGERAAAAADPEGGFRARLWSARALMLLGRMKECRAALEPLRREAAGDPVRVAWTSGMFSMLLHREGDLAGALGEARRSVALAREAKDEKLEAFAVGILGTAQSLSGQYREAVESNAKRLAIDRRIGPPSEVALALSNLGIDQKHLGRFDEALASYDEALTILDRSGNRAGMAIPLLNAANVRLSLGDLEQSLKMHEASLRISEETGSLYGQAINHNDMGELYLDGGNLSAARGHLEKALAIGRSAPFVYTELVALEHLGKLHLQSGDLEAARARLQEALTIADARGYGRQKAVVRALLARTQARRGERADARALADEALRQASALEDPEAEIEALEARAAVLEATGDPAAPDAYLRAIDFLESLRGRLALGDLRKGVSEPYFSVYEGAIRILMRAGKSAAAFDVAERARARMLLRLMAARGPDRGAKTRETEVRRKLSEASEALATAPRQARAPWQREVDELTQELARQEEGVRRNDPATAAARYAATTPVSRLQAELLHNPGRALLAFFWGDEDVYGWWVENENLRGARLGASAALASQVAFLAAAVSERSGGPDWKPPARRVFADLVAPLAPSRVDEILVVPDGPLCRLPFETLVPADGTPPWGLSARFVYGPSASVLLALRGRPHPSRFEGAILAVGNPLVQPDALGVAHASRSGRGPLPFAEEEAKDVVRIVHGAGSRLLLGAEATPERWRSLEPAGFRYLHFATHAEVSDRHPQQTTLLLSGGGLALPEIQGLSLSAELVTLSACDTALGQRVRGEGVIGLPQAFLAAGAGGVVVSLWRVEDRSTAAYMRDFYALLEEGVRPAEALLEVRRARAALSGEEAHPSRWAPFILVGGSLD